MLGASGYLGSLLVEQLLRTTDVGKIYVLIRGKRGQTAKERLRKLLQSGLFHLVRENITLLKKVSRQAGYNMHAEGSRCAATAAAGYQTRHACD